MTTHTPGSWTIQQLETAHNGYDDWPTFAIRDAKTNVCIATVGDVDHYDSEHNPQRARLIAAAPDLLAALKQILEGDTMQGKANYSHADVIQEHYKIARQAIAKAEGEN